MTTSSCGNKRPAALLQGPLLLALALSALLSFDPATPLPKAAAASKPRSISIPLCFHRDTSPAEGGSNGFSVLGADPWLHVTASTASYAGSAGDNVTMHLVDALPNAMLVGEEMLSGRMNRLIGSNPAGWRTNVPLFGRLRAERVYPGISLEYYGSNGQLEYDFTVSPNVDPSIIRWRVRGAKEARIDADGALVLESAKHTIRQPEPVIYQQRNGRRELVEGGYQLTNRAGQEYEFGFRIGRYDRERPLVIDPVINYSSYLGGNSLDQGEGVALDAAGMVYVAGSTGSSDFPRTSGSLAGIRDAFVLKLDPHVTGPTSLVYATFIGGSGEDFGFDIAIDSLGRPAVTGETRSADFPFFRGVMADPGDGVVSDGFVVQLTPAGDALRYATYLGGEAVDRLVALDVTIDQRIVVAGSTHSDQYPVFNAFQSAHHPGSADAAYSMIDPSLSGPASLRYSTYLGGQSADVATGIVAHPHTKKVFLSGSTRSTDFPITTASFQGPQGGTDAFVVGTSPDLSGPSSLINGTLLGGEADDFALDIAVSAQLFPFEVYVTGKTSSLAFPTSADALQRDKPGADAFFTVLDDFQLKVVYSTYLGGNLDDEGHSIQADSGGAVLVGTTSSTDFTTLNQVMKDPIDGASDAFVLRFSRARKLIYSTYLGGNGADIATGVALDPIGAPTVTGRTGSNDFPITPSFQGDRPGTDAFVTILSSGPPNPPSELTPFALSSETIRLRWVDNSLNESGFIVRRRTGGGPVDSSIPFPPNPGVATLRRDVSGEANKTYTFTVEALNDEGASISKAASISTMAPPALDGLLSLEDGVRVVRLDWVDNTAIETRYEVERSVELGPFQPLATTGADIETFVDNGAPNAAAYRVRAANIKGFSSYSDLFASEFEFPAPKNLTGFLTQKSDGSIQVKLQWQLTSRLADSIVVSKSTDGGAFITAAALGSQVSHFFDSNVSQGHTYTYVVRSRGSQSSAPSNQINVRVAQFSAPTNLIATLTAPDTARLTYQDNALGEFVYEVERRVGTGDFQVVVRHELVPLAETGGRVTTVPVIKGETNTFRVRAGAAFSNLNTSPLASPYSNEASVKSALPDAPTDVVATATDSITSVLRWTDNSLGETGFVVEKSVNGGAFSLFRNLGPNITTITEGGRDGGGTNQNRSYRVRARNGMGDSAPGVSSVDMLAAPSSLTAAAGRGNKILSWKDNCIAETGFSVETRLKGSATFKVVGTAAANATSFAVPLGTVEIDAARIRAVAGARSVSSYSNIVSTVPVDQPAKMTATATDSTTVRLKWTDNSDNENGFELQRRGAGKPWTTIQDLPEGSEAATDATAASEHEYQYRVRAVAGISASEWCPEWPLVFTLNAPSGLSSKRNVHGLRLIWLDRSTHETGYEVERRVGNRDWERIKSLGANTSRFTDSKAPWGRRLRYRVWATGSNSTSSYSNEVRAGG